MKRLENRKKAAMCSISQRLCGRRHRRLEVAAGATATSEVVLWCRDVDALFGAALDAGATSLAPPRDSPDARIRYGWVRAPGGHQLKFVALL